MDNRQLIDKQPAEISENSDAIANVKSITNICYDCLERIFKFLDLESLLSVANTCKRLQIAAAAYYGDVYGKRRVNIWTERGSLRGRIHYDDDDTIDVNTLNYCLPFLRCFGPKILRLRVYYDQRNDGSNYVDRHINQYCAKTLNSITFFSSPVFSIANFPNPFECVEEVCMTYTQLKGQLAHLANLFPKLRKLDMSLVSVDGNCADVHFPNLEKLTIDIYRQEDFTMKNLLDLLHANLQLQKLEFNMTNDQGITVNEILNVISQNPSITKLKLWNFFITNINPADLMRFVSEHPHMVKLDLSSHRIPPQDVIIFIRQFKSLKKFRFAFNDQADYDCLVSQLDSEWKHEHDISLSGEHLITLNL